MLWWTWHDSDSASTHRLVNVPLHRTSLCSCSTLAVFLVGCPGETRARWAPQWSTKPPHVYWRAAGWCCLAVPGMLLLMPISQIITSLQAPPPSVALQTVGLTVGVLAALIFVSCFDCKAIQMQDKYPCRSRHLVVLVAVACHLGVMAMVAVVHDSSSQLSTGVHQASRDDAAGCTEKEQDFAGHRFKHLCVDRHLKQWPDFRFNCTALSASAVAQRVCQ